MALVYRFSQDLTEGSGSMRDILGGKGAGLAEMCRLGVPVPPGFTISTQACLDFLNSGGRIKEDLRAEILEKLAWLEGELGKTFNGAGMPLLLSVRSGARTSMPGMMDTILNLGLNSDTVLKLGEMTGNPRFAYDSYRRFIQMYSGVVLGLGLSEFELKLEETREREGVKRDSDISAEGLKQLVESYKGIVAEELGEAFPEDPLQQLWGAIGAVFSSWHNPRAKFYRKIHDLPDDWGTAVTVQSMVFGNLGENSATGVCFSRNPSTGEPVVYGEYLFNAQGEDVVAGIRTPLPINEPDNPGSMRARLPDTYDELDKTLKRLEQHFGDMQDTEFTIEDGRLFLLQTRTGKRTSSAGLRIAIDLCAEGLIDEKEALRRIDPQSMSQLLASEFNSADKEHFLRENKLLGRGLNAGPGAAAGRVVLSAELAIAWKQAGHDVILVREETSPEDIAGMHSAAGILTQRGGMTSHAAVVARGMGKPCVVGCAIMTVDEKARVIRFQNREIAEGDAISIDGTTGEVIEGLVPRRESNLLQQLADGNNAPGTQAHQFRALLEWAERVSTMAVRANADSPKDARVARLLGAKGIGLCRTEHMFFGEDRIFYMRCMILSEDEPARTEALTKILPFQTDDFYQLFREMDGLPVNIRLLDPPLHEFLPQSEDLIRHLADHMHTTPEALHQRINQLHEFNPMLGHRGCRLGISHPAIYQMQVRAIAGAVAKARADGIDVRAEIMVPLVAVKAELDAVIASIKPILGEFGLDIPVGTMIEIPRAALTAGEIALSAAFFSFGTNDLTQCGLGLSRDDSGSFLPLYKDRGIFPHDPFKSLDQKGIGRLVEIAAKEGRETNPGLKLGVCGEHGGDPRSITFFNRIGLNYVSCSPYRVPIAILAAARASLEVAH